MNNETLLLSGLLLLGMASLAPLPVWVLRQANRQRPYKLLLFGFFLLTGALLYVSISNNGYFSEPINNALLGAGIYGAISCIVALLAMAFGIKREGFTAQHEQLERDRWQAFEERKAESVSSRQDDGWGIGNNRPGDPIGYGYRPGDPLGSTPPSNWGGL